VQWDRQRTVGLEIAILYFNRLDQEIQQQIDHKHQEMKVM